MDYCAELLHGLQSLVQGLLQAMSVPQNFCVTSR